MGPDAELGIRTHCWGPEPGKGGAAHWIMFSRGLHLSSARTINSQGIKQAGSSEIGFQGPQHAFLARFQFFCYWASEVLNLRLAP